MKGYFITEEQAEQMNLVKKAKDTALQKVMVVFTETDLEEEMRKRKISMKWNEEKKAAFSLWFYKNYYDSFWESLVSFYEKSSQ